MTPLDPEPRILSERDAEAIGWWFRIDAAIRARAAHDAAGECQGPTDPAGPAGYITPLETSRRGGASDRDPARVR